MLVLALLVAGAFAALGQWQLSRAIASDPADAGPTEVIVPLTDVIAPTEHIPDVLVGQRVSVTGRLVPGDALVIGKRVQGEELGYWVTGHIATDAPGTPGLAVALGWAPDRESAEAVAERLREAPAADARFEGRLLPSQGPLDPERGADPFALNEMSVAALVNLWDGLGQNDVYLGYLLSAEPAAGLEGIDAPEPDNALILNWMNIFYAVEWAVFAGFAGFLWYRLARDAWEKELDSAAAERGEPSPFE